MSEAGKKWSSRHPDRARASLKRWKQKHKEEQKKYFAQYWIEHKEERRAMKRRWAAANREHLRRKAIERIRAHPEYASARNALKRVLVQAKSKKTSKTMQYVGCTPGFLRNHLESLFKPGMTWENWGEWHVDHIIPLSWFPVEKDQSLIYVACHWTNLQPLWAEENRSKHDKVMDQKG